MLQLRFHPEEEIDVAESHGWYQEMAQGLGDDFLTELEESYQAILELPDTWPKFKRGFRRYLLSRFPFAVLYKKLGDMIYIVAIMLQSRRTNYWLDRV